jgi:adenylate kinase
MRKYVIIGAQGSGKGTQAKRLAEDYELEHMSVGDIFRWNIQHHTKLGAGVRRTVAAGELVSDELVGDIVRTRLEQHDWNYGFIIDGFPRNAAQAEFFLETYDIDSVIHVWVPDEVVQERVLSRRLCSQCGLDYNLIYSRPAKPDTCDVCGGSLVRRDDDTPAALRTRLRDYHEKTTPVLELFERKEVVVTVDGTRMPDEVFEETRDKLGLPPVDDRATPGVPASA